MQKNEVIQFLNKIDAHIIANLKALTSEQPFELKIIGKSALLLTGLTDSIGTVDIDSLGIDGQPPSIGYGKILENLKEEFGRAKLTLNDYTVMA
jgi:phosphoribosylamine-glycine ligase